MFPCSIGGLILRKNQNSIRGSKNEIKLELHKEELEISKKNIEMGRVKAFKKVFTIEKKILVPVTYEELIIEKEIINPDNTSKVETIRIPLSEEHIEVKKHTVIIEKVDMCKQTIEEIIPIIETLKTEKLNIESAGDIKVTVDQMNNKNGLQ